MSLSSRFLTEYGCKHLYKGIGPLQGSEMHRYAWFDFSLEPWIAALTWGSVIVD
jgi:hypothetical protein